MTGLGLAILIIGAGALGALFGRWYFRDRPEPACRCGHLGLAHEHYRSTDRREECALCACEEWRPVR